MKSLRLCCVLVSLLMLVGVLASCNDGGQATTASPADTDNPQQPAPAAGEADDTAAGDALFVGISFPSTLVDRWINESALVKAELEALGYRAEVQFADEDANLQVQQCDNFLSQGVDMLVVCAVDTTTAASIVDKAHAENVPVVSYCRMIENCDVDAFVAEDNEMVGTLQGQYIVDHLPSGNIIILGGSPADSNGILYREKGAEALQDKIDSGDYVVIADQYCEAWQPTAAMSHVENALTQAGNDIAAILCPNDGLAGGAIEALAQQQLDGQVIVTGGDGELAAAKRILSGTQTMTLFKDPVKIGGAAVAAIDALLSGEQPAYNATLNNGFKEVDAVLVEMTLITQDNLYAEMVDSGYFTEAELNG